MAGERLADTCSGEPSDRESGQGADHGTGIGGRFRGERGDVLVSQAWCVWFHAPKETIGSA